MSHKFSTITSTKHITFLVITSIVFFIFIANSEEIQESFRENSYGLLASVSESGSLLASSTNARIYEVLSPRPDCVDRSVVSRKQIDTQIEKFTKEKEILSISSLISMVDMKIEDLQVVYATTTKQLEYLKSNVIPEATLRAQKQSLDILSKRIADKAEIDALEVKFEQTRKVSGELQVQLDVEKNQVIELKHHLDGYTTQLADWMKVQPYLDAYLSIKSELESLRRQIVDQEKLDNLSLTAYQVKVLYDNAVSRDASPSNVASLLADYTSKMSAYKSFNELYVSKYKDTASIPTNGTKLAELRKAETALTQKTTQAESVYKDALSLYSKTYPDALGTSDLEKKIAGARSEYELVQQKYSVLKDQLVTNTLESQRLNLVHKTMLASYVSRPLGNGGNADPVTSSDDGSIDIDQTTESLNDSLSDAKVKYQKMLDTNMNIRNDINDLSVQLDRITQSLSTLTTKKAELKLKSSEAGTDISTLTSEVQSLVGRICEGE